MQTRRQPPIARPTNLNASGGGGGSANIGIKIVKPDVRAQVYSPSWSGTETIVRPFPSLSYSNPEEFEPYFNEEIGQFGNWIRRYDCAWKIGKGQNKRTFLITNTSNSDFYDCSQSPLSVMYNNLYKLKKDTKAILQCPTLPGLFEGEANSSAPLSRPKNVYLIQGVLLVHGSQPKFGPDPNTGRNRSPLGVGDSASCIFMIPGGSKREDSASAGKILLGMCSEENESYSDSSNFEERFKYGDIVHPDHGRFIVFRQAGAPPAASQIARPTAQAKRQASANLRGGAGNGRSFQGQSQYQGYEVELVDLPLLSGVTPRFNSPEDLADIRKHWLYWEEALYFPTPVEQARELNEAFDPAEIVLAFSGCDPDWITDETWKKYRGSVTARAETPPTVDRSGRSGYGAPPSVRPAPQNASAYSRPAYEAQVEEETEERDDPFDGGSLDNIRDTGRVTFSGGRVTRTETPDVIVKAPQIDEDDEEDVSKEIEGFFSNVIPKK